MDNPQDYVRAYWVKQLSQVQLPALAGTIRELNAVAQSDDSCASQLADIILKDSALTARVLRIANSVYHNPNSNNPINTISRAVVQLGFRGVKAISLSVMMVESLLHQDARDRMIEWMARGFHTGVQAELLLEAIDFTQHIEEVFITSLLLHLGELTFWSCQNDIVSKLDRILDEHSTGDTLAERAVLGASMKEISRALARAWVLDDYVREALNPGAKPGKLTQAVLLGETICLAVEQGWDSPAFEQAVREVALFTGKSQDDARRQIEEGVEKAAGIAVIYGANSICHFIPSTLGNGRKRGQSVMVADLQLQLDVLRELGDMVDQMVDTNTLFQTVVEGIHRGIGLERVALCLVDPKAGTVKSKYVLGEDTEEWRGEMEFSIGNDQDNLLAWCLYNRQQQWLQPGVSNAHQHLINKKMQNLLTADNALIAPIYAGNRQIGIVIADRGPRKTSISREQQESFEHFAKQITTSLSLLASKRSQAQ